MEHAVGLRERKKEAARQALHEAALRLVAEQGLEHVTVEAIAEAASLSRRTFSNYFPSKEGALFYHDARRVQMLLRFLHERPLDEPPRTALIRAAERMFADIGPADPASLPLRRLLRRHPSLLGHHVAAYAATERELAAELARRLPGADPGGMRARVLAATFLAALRVATDAWFDAPERPLREVVAEALRYAQE